jgi:hypothetical protein
MSTFTTNTLYSWNKTDDSQRVVGLGNNCNRRSKKLKKLVRKIMHYVSYGKTDSLSWDFSVFLKNFCHPDSRKLQQTLFSASTKSVKLR